jgi:hypothetical protein
MNQSDPHAAHTPIDTPEVLANTVLDPEKAGLSNEAFALLSPADRAKYAMGWLHTARFLTTAAQLHHLPAYDLWAVPMPANPPASTC